MRSTRGGSRGAPEDVLGGQYSLPFTTAVALTRDLAVAYNDEAVHDPLVRDLAQRIELVPLPDEASPEVPGFWPAEVLIECGAERHTLQTRPYKGSPSNPFTWPEACEKFRRYTATVLDAPRVAAIIDAVDALEQASDVADIARLVAGP
ncbi:MAG TPA: hypothetical protein VMS64_01740 [Candidatus Methylomirabilis sp.]|nr:hypothetical protein [Candidatus Methylomirabilis sp.]